jgi:hypothetical protein
LFLPVALIPTGGAFLWAFLQEPATIPYEAWVVPRDPSFPLARTEPDGVEIRNDDMLNSPDFLFTMGVGSGMYGLDVFRVDATGNATYVFSTGHDHWWMRDFRMAPEQVAKLRRLLVDVDYRTMARAYYADVADGTQWGIRVDVNGSTKQVYCNNYFPEAAERLADTVRKDLLPAHDKELRSARRIFHSTARNIAAPLWR